MKFLIFPTHEIPIPNIFKVFNTPDSFEFKHLDPKPAEGFNF